VGLALRFDAPDSGSGSETVDHRRNRRRANAGDWVLYLGAFARKNYLRYTLTRSLDVHDSYIEFEEPDRKNGQGQVSLMFGLDALANLLDERAQQPNWDGYLFPTDAANRSFLSSRQMRRRFKDLCRKAGVDVDGDVGTRSTAGHTTTTSWQMRSQTYWKPQVKSPENRVLTMPKPSETSTSPRKTETIQAHLLPTAHPSNPARRRPHRVQHPYQPRQLI